MIYLLRKFKLQKNLYSILNERGNDSHPVVTQCVKGFNYRRQSIINPILGKNEGSVQQ